MNTYLYIGGVNIDLFEDVPITIDYALTDVMEPASRKVSHTKTIELPNTPNNASVFHQLFVINKDNTISGYDPNLRVVAFVQNGSGNLIEGYFQLTGIVKNGNDIRYQGVIYSDGKNLFSQMGDSFIQGNTDSSQDVDLGTGTTEIYYQYGSSYYGKTVANNFAASSDSVALGIIDSGTNTTNTTYPYYYVPYTNLRMAIKLKHIFDRIFTKYGCTYSSSFLNSLHFKKHVYLDTHKTANLTTAQYEQLYTNVYYGSDSVWLSNGDSIIYNAERVDIGNKYNPVTGVYSIASNRDYLIQVNNQVKGRITFTAPYTATTNEDFFCNIIFNLRYNSGVIASSACYQKIVIPAGSYIIGQSIEFTISTPNLSSLQLNHQSNGATSGSNYTTTISFTGTAGYPVSLSAKILANSSMTIAPATKSLGYNDLYSPNSVPASQHKQKDFIGDVLRMFNLYVLFDGVNYIIEPRDNFFELGTTYDWTMKVDRSQPIEIIPVGQLNWKQIQFIPALDNDYYSQKYNTDLKQVYGQQNVLNQNEFITDTKKVELKFAAPLTVSTAPNYPKLNHMYKLNNGVAEAIDGLPRYAYWGGWLEEEACSHQMNSPFAASANYNGYPYIGEYDNPVSSTYSCLFGPPSQIYFQSFLPIGLSDNDLYTIYYSNELNNQVSANAKIIRCSVLLQPLEINNIRLYDTVIIDGVRCIISKISDYNTTTIQPTQVELIQYVQ